VRFKRPPANLVLFPAALLHEDAEGLVTLNILHPTEHIVVNGLTVVDRGYLGVWYVSFLEWHDVGAVYNTEKVFMGYYSDIATPIKRLANGYEMTDLFLDLWVFPDGRHAVLDQDQFDKAAAERWLDKNQINQAKTELEKLVKAVKSKKFPPSKIKRLIALPEDVEDIAAALQKLQTNVQHRHMS